MMRPVGRAARRPPLSCIGRQARQARSGYSGAASPRGIGNWMPANADFNQLLGMDSGRMRARVRDLVRNFPPFARAVNAMVAFTVGSGARFQSLATLPDGSPDIPTRKRIEDRFRAWMEHADVAGRLHFYEIQQLCKRQECECGEYLLRFARPRDRRRGLLGLQIYEPENLSSWRIEGQEPDSDIWQGIEYDIWTGEPLAYHFQTVFGWERQLRTWREPAFNVLHGFQTLRPGQRTLLYCRSSIIGAHRWGGIWLGDNHSSWSQLLANIQMMPAVQMCGFLYSGADLCGFSEDTTPDLALRWLEFGLFTPLMRNHADAESRDQEFYRFTDVLPAIRNMLDLRYALLPYLYSEFMKAALEDAPYFRPLAFDYPADPDAREVDDQLLLGEGLMVAPVHTQNAHGRTVYLPEAMKMLRLRSVSDYDEEVLPAGRHYLPCELDEVLLFIRPGHTVPVAQPAANTAQLNDTALTFWRFAPDGQPAPYRMYTDDGVTTDHNKPEHWRIVGQ